MKHQAKAVLWVDDEAELLEPHRMFLRDKGFEVETATNADDAAELVRRRPFDLVLLDEQMPGTRGLESFAELRDIDPTLQVVMVTKSEEDSTLTEALGSDIAGYLVKPVSPRQVYALVARMLEGPRIRQQAIARSFVDRFRAMQNESLRDLDWRGWIDRYLELVQWDLDLTSANEMGLHDSLQGLFPDLRREFASFMAQAYPAWLKDLEGDRPPLSIDIVQEFLLPVSPGHIVQLARRLHAALKEQILAVHPSTFKDEVQLIFDAVKMNYELLGNQIGHIHWHLVPRRADDPAPRMPAWTVEHAPRRLTAAETAERIAQIRGQLGV